MSQVQKVIDRMYEALEVAASVDKADMSDITDAIIMLAAGTMQRTSQSVVTFENSETGEKFSLHYVVEPAQPEPETSEVVH